MGSTILEKILGAHGNKTTKVGEIIDCRIDIRAARDFGGANVVGHLRKTSLPLHDPARTLFTFDCNPSGSDQKYAANQQLCRQFALDNAIEVFDINQGIGTHLAIEKGLVRPGDTFISTDSHANILGAICAFGQGMGDQDVAHAFAYGSVWFKVPPSVKIIIEGRPSPEASPKDATLALLKHFGANGLLGVAAELYGDYIDELDLAGRITMASMFTEMGAIIGLFPLNDAVEKQLLELSPKPITRLVADPDASYEAVHVVNINGIGPQISKPGHPEDAVAVPEVAGTPIDSALIGSCTNGRIEDLRAAARVLRGQTLAKGVVLKIVPASDGTWKQALEEGLIAEFKRLGALVANAGCAGCAAGQVGQNGPGEVTLTTGNRNFAGKQGQGEVYLASPETIAASAVAGVITTSAHLLAGQLQKHPRKPSPFSDPVKPSTTQRKDPPTKVSGRAWVIPVDNIDTDMIFHNKHLAVTELSQMGQYAFGNLKGHESFAKEARPGDVVVVGKNFGAGSSRQQAVDCFLALGISAIVGVSFGAIYERNAINAGLPIMGSHLVNTGIQTGDELTIDFKTGLISIPAKTLVVSATPLSEVQLRIYQRGGLLALSI